MNKKRIIILSTIIFIALTTAFFVSYGFITTYISGNETSKKTVFNNQLIKVEYSDGTETLISEQEGYFIPGSTITKTFTVKNTGNTSVTYSVNLTDITNNFIRKEDLTYEIKSGSVVLGNGIFPDSETYIVSKEILNKGETKTYTLTINYLTSEENQIIDQGKIINAKINISDRIVTIKKLNIYGNTVQDTLTYGDPSPTNPVEIQSLGIKRENLFDINSEILGTYSTDISINGSNIIATSKGSATYQNAKFKLRNIDPGTKITMTGNWVSSGNNIGRILLSYYDTSTNKTTSTILTISNSGDVESVVIPEKNNENEIIVLIVYSNLSGTTKPGDTITYSNIQLEKNVTKPTDYDKLGKYEININSRGKNYVDEKTFKPTGSGSTVIEESTYYDITTNVNTQGIYWPINEIFTVGDKVSATVKIEYVSTARQADSVTLRIYNATQKKWIHAGANGIEKDFATIEVGSTKTLQFKGVTITSDTYEPGDEIQLRVTRGSAQGSSGNNEINFKVFKGTIMLEKSSVPTEYEPYSAPVKTNIYLDEPLRKIGECETCVDYVNIPNKEITRHIGMYFFNGSETIREYNSTDSYLRLVTSALDGKVKEKSQNNIFSNYFKGTNTLGTHNSIRIASGNSRTEIYLEPTTTYADFVSWLSSNKVEINYILESNSNNIIELPKIDISQALTRIIEVCSDNGVCASNIEVEYEE